MESRMRSGSIFTNADGRKSTLQAALQNLSPDHRGFRGISPLCPNDRDRFGLRVPYPRVQISINYPTTLIGAVGPSSGDDPLVFVALDHKPSSVHTFTHRPHFTE